MVEGYFGNWLAQHFWIDSQRKIALEVVQMSVHHVLELKLFMVKKQGHYVLREAKNYQNFVNLKRLVTLSGCSKALALLGANLNSD